MRKVLSDVSKLNPSNWLRRSRLSALLAASSCLIMIVSFQNCSGGFKAQSLSSNSAIGSSSSSSSDSSGSNDSGNSTVFTPTPLRMNAYEPPANPNADVGQFIEVDWTCSTGLQMNYRLLLPAGYDSSKYRYPLVTVLSSSGVDVLTDNASFDQEVGSIFNIANTRQQYPSFVLVPQGSSGDTWGQSYSGSTQSGDCARQLIHQVVLKYSIDIKRVYLTGGWDGGSGTWDWLAREPDFFAAGIPQGGSVADSTFATNLKDMPIWAFYGQFIYGGGHEDHITAMVSAIEAQGGTKVKFTENPLGDPAGMYGPWNVNPLRPGVLTWLYSQRHL